MSTAETEVREGSPSRSEDQREKVDFKMITFSLGGREYGIDIMKVKEISKIDHFTYVPNGSPFLRGVYNLRGDIIPIIDLRIMFHLPLRPPTPGKPEDVIILITDEQTMGVVVDSISKVIGVSSQRVKPVHPLFVDINLKYLSGVIEYDDQLYIVLDVDRILGIEEKGRPRAGAEEGAGSGEARLAERQSPSEPAVEPGPSEVATAAGTEETVESLELGFIRETLAAFRNFAVTDLNVEWVAERLAAWRDVRSSEGRDVQLVNASEADDFLEPFYSPYTGEFWAEGYVEEIERLLPEIEAGAASAWNPGCGKGQESYSLAALLLKHYKGKRVKVWANDNDLLGISMAPTLTFLDEVVTPLLSPFVTKGRSGSTFRQELKDCILFEYHDILHPNPFPEVDLIVARDILSFFDPAQQGTLLGLFRSKLRVGGLLVIGAHERLSGPGWKVIGEGGAVGYEKLADEQQSSKEQES